MFIIDINNIEIGGRLCKERKRRGMTMKEVAVLVNLHESSVQRYESGLIKNISIDKLKEFAKVLGLTLEYLVGDTQSNEDINTNEEIHSFAMDLIKGIQSDKKTSILDTDGNVPQYLIDLIINAIKMDDKMKKATKP